MDQADQKAEEKNPCRRELHHIDRLEFPELPAQRPIKTLRRRDLRTRTDLRRCLRLRHSVGRDVHCTPPCSARFPTTATNKSEMLGVRPSPRDASRCRSTFSK